MIEIKFRGLSKSGIWHFGYLWVSPDGKHWIKEIVDEKGQQADFEVLPKTVGQYTVIKDKNGNDIYEGDIVINPRGKHSVYWHEGGAKWAFDKVYEDVGRYLRVDLYGTGYRYEEYEVIGNIYENPELLKESK